MTLWRKPTRVRTVLQRLGRWLDRNINYDRWIGIVGFVSTLVLGILGIIASLSHKLLASFTVAFAILLLLTGIALYLAIRATTVKSFSIHRYPYKLLSRDYTLDIIEDGHIALLTSVERIFPLQDHLIAIRVPTRGLWDTPRFDDFQCLQPESAVVVDMFNDSVDTVYLVSLRSIYNYGDVFTYSWRIKYREGFLDPVGDKFGTHVKTDIDLLTLRLVLPTTKRLVRDRVRLRVGHPGQFNEYPLGGEYIDLTDDRRDRITWSFERPIIGVFYQIVWEWKPI